MSVVLKNEVKDKIKLEFANLVTAGKSPADSKKELAAKYSANIKTIRKIVTAANKEKASKANTYIFTSWELRCSIDAKFIKLLYQIAQFYNAKIRIAGISGKDDLSWLAFALKKQLSPDFIEKFTKIVDVYEKDADEYLNKNLQFKSIEGNALAINPLSGLEHVFNKSTIVPTMTKEAITEKSLKLCNQILGTGGIGKLTAKLEDYSLLTDVESRKKLETRWKTLNKPASKAYHAINEFIEPTALIIDILDDNTFFSRYITMRESGVVYDKNYKFTVDKKPEKSRPESLVLGDFHVIDLDLTNYQAIKEIAKELNPKSAVLNDFTDFVSINYHLWNDHKNIVKLPTLTQEQEITSKYLAEITKQFDTVYYLESNHDQFLVKFLANDYQQKLGSNYLQALELRTWQLKTGRHPVIKFLEMDSFKNLKFVSVHHDLIIKGNYIIHGDLGLNGARTGFKALAKVYKDMVCGHFHSPQTIKNSVCVGISSKLKLGYNLGPSNWMHSHTLIQPDGTKQSLNVIDGKWRI